MKVVLTDEALRDLDEILSFIRLHYPAMSLPFETRLRAVLRRIGNWPRSAPGIEQRPEVRVAPLIRYPYKIFYQVSTEAIEILHIHHAARQSPWEPE